MLDAWRIADPAFSQTTEQMLSGEGAYLFGGRWNSKGIRMVYLGSSLAQAAMELLAHLGRPGIIKKFNKLPISFDESLVMCIDIDDLPVNWTESTMQSAVQATGDAWAKNQNSLLLQVPSVVVPGDCNYLLNPSHPDMKKLVIGEITSFEFDPRLVK